MPDDPLSTTPPVAAPVPRQEGSRKVVCEFCGCQLAPTGEIVKMGEDARKFRDHNEKLADKEKEISSLQSEITSLKAKIAELEGSHAPRESERSVGNRIGR
jgi:hypothetical protein